MIGCIEWQKIHIRYNLRWSSKFLFNLYVNDFLCIPDFNIPLPTDISRWLSVLAVFKDISQLLLQPFWIVKKFVKLSKESAFHIRQIDCDLLRFLGGNKNMGKAFSSNDTHKSDFNVFWLRSQSFSYIHLLQRQFISTNWKKIFHVWL